MESRFITKGALLDLGVDLYGFWSTLSEKLIPPQAGLLIKLPPVVSGLDFRFLKIVT